jgi:hypothetical protein
MDAARAFILKGSIPEPNTSCWLWQLSLNRDGYARAHGKTYGSWEAHLVSYRAFVGEVPAGCEIDHACRVQGRQTHCKRGHEFTALNTYRWRQARICRQCRSERSTR